MVLKICLKILLRCEVKQSGGLHKGRSFQEKVKVFGDFEWASVLVTSRCNGEIIRFEGSFANFLQGHNVAGINDMFALCYATAEKAL